VGIRLAFARFDARCRARIMIAAAAHCPWDKVWSNLGLAMATLLLPSLFVEGRDGECLATRRDLLGSLPSPVELKDGAALAWRAALMLPSLSTPPRPAL
jgi:hypothetical protein